MKSWWNKGGEFIGNDLDGEPMYTLTNGEAVMFGCGMIAIVIVCIALFIYFASEGM